MPAFLQTLLCITFFFGGLAVAYGADDAPSLSMPIACTIGADCFIQNYTDADAGPDYRDYHCGFLSYDGHNGTDFRIDPVMALATGTPVLAAADGVVKAARDGMDDINVRAIGRPALLGKDAGNSVIIAHGEDWESQYAHLKKGSVAVHAGQQVSRGTLLGLVGLSGNTEFLHLHFEIRHKGKAIDPFIGTNGGGTCGLGKKPLWQTGLVTKLAYIPTTVFTAGFTDHPPRPEEEPAMSATLPADAPALVFNLTLLGAQADDQEAFDFFAPDGTVLAHTNHVIDRNMAQFRSFVGKKRKQQHWPRGEYRVTFHLLRKQKPLIDKEFKLSVF